MHALDQVRYLADVQRDSNVSRQQLHSLWIAAQEVAARNLLAFRSGLTPDQVREIERDTAIERYATIAYSGALGLGVSLGIEDDEIAKELPALADAWIRNKVMADPQRHEKALRRMRKRLHFVEGPR